VRARLGSDVPIKAGDRLGLSFRPEKLSIFARASGRAIPTALHDAASSEGGRR
jgi:multiple sugar transport system ATP-binding protein